VARDTDDFDREDWEPEPEPDPSAAARRVKPPAVALIVVGVVSLLFVGWNVYWYYAHLPGELAQARAQMLPANADDSQPSGNSKEILDLTEQAMYVIYPVNWGLQGLLALVMIGGAIPLVRGKGRGWGLLAAVAAVIPHFGCLAWLFSLAVGIWALIVLNNRDVKRAFAANK
jgi:hypothetical protein